MLKIPVKSNTLFPFGKNHSRVYVLLIVVYLLVNGGKMVLSLNADQICNENESTLIVDISLVMSHLHLLHFAISCVCPLARAKLVVRVIWKKKGNFEDGYTRKGLSKSVKFHQGACMLSYRETIWTVIPFVILMLLSSAKYCFIFTGSGNYIALPCC